MGRFGLTGVAVVAMVLAWGDGEARAGESSMGIVPGESCGCPPEPMDYKGTYGIYGMTGDKALEVNLQGWSRIGLSEGASPDIFGYMGKDGTNSASMIQRVKTYGTRVDLVVDIGGREAQEDPPTKEDGEDAERAWLDQGQGAWVEGGNLFSVINLAEEIDSYVNDAGCDGVLLRFPMSYIGDFFNVTATDSQGDSTPQEVLPRHRVMSLIYKLRKMAKFKSGELSINLCLTHCADAREDTVLMVYLEKLLAEVDLVLLDMAALMKGAAFPKLNTALWQYDTPLVTLRDGNKSQMYHVVGHAWYERLQKKEGYEPIEVALALGFGGLAMELTDASKSAFVDYNRKRLEDQSDFFAGIIWRTGLGNALCFRRHLIKWAAWGLGGVLALVALLSFWLSPVRAFVARFCGTAIGSVLLFVGLLWVYEAVNPTENNWTNETVGVLLGVFCVALVLVWGRHRQREQFP